MIQLARIVCAVDFSDTSRKALAYARTLATWYDARVLALYVYTPGPMVAPMTVAAGVPMPPEPDELREEVREFCTDTAHVPQERIDPDAAIGDPAREIVRRADEERADLLVIGSHGRGGFERLFLGSVTAKVLRSANAPVLVIPPGARDMAAPLFKVILCGVDFSDVSLRAVEHALQLAQEGDAQLVLAHVIEHAIDPVVLAQTPHLPIADYMRDRAVDAAARLQALIPEEARTWSRPETRVSSGRASRELLKLAGEIGAELVVLGAHGRGAIDRLFGSTTDDVIRRAPCPVLSVSAASGGVT